MGAFGPADILDLPPPPREPEPRSAGADRGNASAPRPSPRWWFSFDGWHSGNLDEEFVLA
ncbi:MAG TPA: hypothetical protein VM925_33490 [Labilithrix sp.]|nr:hypothetical protein [Labilithrix sp.]